MKSTCPHCSKVHLIPDKYADKKIKCPSCAEAFVAIEDKDVVINQIVENAKRADGTLLSEPRDFSMWYMFGMLAAVIIACVLFNILGIVIGLIVLFFCLAVGNILYELRVIAHYHRERSQKKSAS